MNQYLIRYETYDGEVRTVEVAAYDRPSAVRKLVNCREVHWVRSVVNTTNKLT